MEHKTITEAYKDAIDAEVMLAVADGWVLDSRHFGLNNDGALFVAFLSRGVPLNLAGPMGSPPPVKQMERVIDCIYCDGSGITGNTTIPCVSCMGKGKMVVWITPPPGSSSILVPKDEWRETKAKADAYDTYSPDLPRTYTLDQMWDAMHRGRKSNKIGMSDLTASARFKEWLDSLGKPEIAGNDKTEAENLDILRKWGVEIGLEELRRKVAGNALEHGYKQAQRDAYAGRSYDVNDVFRPWWEKYELPPDPLEGDRNLVWAYVNNLTNSEQEWASLGIDLRKKLNEAITRLCGMEVSND